MLALLRIRNLGIIPELELEFEPGFNVLTGETGTGKSLLIDAISLLRGQRGTGDLIRTGENEASVEAIVLLGNKEVVARRVLSRTGRARAYLDGALVTIEELRRSVGERIDLTSQHEHQALLDPATHLAALDEFAGIVPELGRMREAFEALREASNRLAVVAARASDADARLDFLTFQRDEIDVITPMPGEEEALKIARERLRLGGALRQTALAAVDALDGRDRSIVDEISEISRQLGALVSADPELSKHVEALGEARIHCEETARALERYAENIEVDGGRLDEVEDRLHAITKLCRKHGGSVDEVLKRRAAMEAEIQTLANHDDAMLLGRANLERAKNEAIATARALSECRSKAQGELAQEVEGALRELGMERASLRVELSARPGRGVMDDPFEHEGRSIGAHGWDRAEILLSANPGEVPKPIARIASGGELSRVMLALRQALVVPDVFSYVFDEVDTGIGGGTAEKVGKRLASLGQRKQVLCVTHLAQIAAYARAHYLVEKVEIGGRTATQIRKLAPKERQKEVARMLGGVEVTAKTRAHAVEMLERARI